MSNNKYKILFIEDEANIRSLVGAILESNQYQLLTAQTCGMGKTMFLSHHPDLVLLDLGLPDGDGLDFIRFARRDFDTPILILSARSDEQDKVAALDLGANDYVTKPFGTAELMARIRAALRNVRTGSRQDFVLHDLRIDYDKRLVTLGDQPISLTQTEYNIIMFLSGQPGKVHTYNTIIKAVWGYADSGSVKRLQVNMANIRKKLGIRPGGNSYIINELGVGYRMMDENE